MSRDFPGIDFHRLSLSLSSAHVLHISRSQSQIIFQPRVLLVLGIQKKSQNT
jgi:hypothetical protein